MPTGSKFSRILVNLIRNAMDAMHDSPRRELTVTTHRLDRDTVRIDVADTGPGIAPDIADQLFQPFVTTKAQGMGVGLSISRTIVEAQGGRLWADAARGGGAVFHLTLKAVPEATMPTDSVVHLIDDDDAVRRSLAFLLAAGGYAVRVYESATAFLEIAPGLRGGCIVSDVRMPGMDGLALQRRLRELGVGRP